MLKKTVTSLFVGGLICAPLAGADNHMEMQMVPAHLNDCRFQDGKSWEDLDKLTEAFNAYASQGASDYSYWILTPRFREDNALHFVWLGSWNSGAGFGAGFDGWVADAADLEQMFAETADCGSHMVAIAPIVADPEDPPTDGVVWFARCELDDDAELPDAMKAHAEGSAVMRALGVEAHSWAFLPTLGFGDVDFDYYHVATFDSYADLGKGFEANFNQGGWKGRMEPMEDVASCATPNLYDFRIKLAGQPAQ